MKYFYDNHKVKIQYNKIEKQRMEITSREVYLTGIDNITR